MGRSIFRQATQIRKSDVYDDTVTPSLANYETNATDIEYDLNALRSLAQNLLNRNGPSFPSGNWYDDLTQPTTLENGTIRGVDATNAALHLVEKKRVLRDVWKLIDIYPGLDSAIALANDIKAKYNAHIPSTTYHSSGDGTNTVSAADATDLASLITLLNEMKGDYNAHRVEVGVHPTDDSVNIVNAADATNLSSALTLVNDIRTQYEAHRASGTYHLTPDTVNVVAVAAVGATTQFHIFSAAQLPSNTTAAIGAVTTLGTVAAYNASFGAGDLAEVTGSDAVSPKNLMPLVDASNHLDPILIGGKQLFGLFQTESNTDGSTMTGTTPNRAQISFVVRNTTGDDIELVNVPVTQGFSFATRERVRLEDLNEQDFLKGVVVEFPAGTTVTRQVAYNNQGITPVDVTTNSYLDLEGPGLEWQIRDDLEAILFRVIEGSAGGTSKVAIGADVDEFDVNAVVSDFLNGIKVDTGTAGTTINIGVTANQIDCGGALLVQSGAATDLRLLGQGELFLDDGNQTGSTWAQTDGIKLSETTAEWDDFETEFGEVSILNAILQASKAQGIRKVFSVVTVAQISANTDASGPSDDNNLDTDLGDLSTGDFIYDYDVYLNGQLLRGGADAAAEHDYYPGTSLANGQLRFEFVLKINDQLCIMDRAA
jgi:hypothetical protein